MKELFKRRLKLTTIFFALGIFCLIIVLMALIYPMVRRSEAIKLTANTAIERLEGLSVAVGVFGEREVGSLSNVPTAYPQYYQQLSFSLSKIADRLGYKKLMVVTKKGKETVVLADSSYRVSGDEHIEAGAELPAFYKGSSLTLSKIQEAKISSGYANDLLYNQHGAPFVAVYLPIRGADGIPAILVADCDAGSTSYNMLGFINLNQVAIFGLLGMMLFGALLFFTTRYQVTPKPKEEEGDSSTLPQLDPPPPQD